MPVVGRGIGVEAGPQCLEIHAVGGTAIADLNLLDCRFVKQFFDRSGHVVFPLIRLPPNQRTLAIMAFSRPAMIASASPTIRSTSSRQLGTSWIRPWTWPAVIKP
jgi:hypothetical protein